MTRRFWRSVGGLLIEEFCLVDRAPGCGGRWVDGLILPDEETRIASRAERVDIAGKRVISVQTKASRLGMYLMGQTLFSAELLRQRFKPASVESVALCAMDDEVLRPMLEQYPGCRVVVMTPSETAEIDSA